jgi:hypothetical protein
MRGLFKGMFVLFFLTIGAFAYNFNGVWKNSGGNRGVAKIVVKSSGLMKAYGYCVPSACDWGNRRYTRVKSGLLASWRQSGIGHKVILIEPINANKIKATVKYLYCDGRADKTRVDYFKRVRASAVVDLRDRFRGNWVRSNPNSRALTKGKIFKRGSGIYVHLWGSCYPQDCDWGSIPARVSGNKLKLVWEKGFVRRVMTIKGLNYANGRFNKLRIKTINYYNDSRGVRTRVEYMRRAY